MNENFEIGKNGHDAVLKGRLQSRVKFCLWDRVLANPRPFTGRIDFECTNDSSKIIVDIGVKESELLASSFFRTRSY